MNAYNQSIKTRIDKLSIALNVLNKYGCAITAISINDKGSEIEILPPLCRKVFKKLNGVKVSITGNGDGRHNHWQTKINGCTVRWQSHSHLQTH